MSKNFIFIILLSIELLIPFKNQSTSFLPKLNNRIVALNLFTGEIEWIHKSEELSDAYFEVYEQGITVYSNYRYPYNKNNPIFLDHNTGKILPAFPILPEKILTKSYIFFLYHLLN